MSNLTTSQLKNIVLNLNFDMVSSPNFVRFVYDGDGSGTGTSGPNGSGNTDRSSSKAVKGDFVGSKLRK